MSAKHKKTSETRPVAQPTQQQQLIHALGNSLSAARLRLDLLTRDPTCMWAQKANLEALMQTLADAAAATNRLEELSWKDQLK
jgi:hypothetical protein